MKSLDYFLLLMGVEFLGASLIFVVRISNFFSLYAGLLDKLQQTYFIQPSTGQPIPSTPALARCISSVKSPEFQMLQAGKTKNYLKLAKS
jgi:hypothetical protein